MSRPELLAPAGDIECLRTALHFGADAVYIGGDFMQMRSGKVGFTREDIENAVGIAHEAGRKLYVAVNCFARNEEIDSLSEYARFLDGAGADAAIISDIGVVGLFKKTVPSLPVHISTQANCTNYAAANAWRALGADRIVLARELTLEEIAVIRKNTPPDLQLECFVHGAMCMAYSGRCLISSFLNARSGNRGECTQPCRWEYYLAEKKRPGEYFPVEEQDGASAILSSHDLRCIDFLDRIESAGVCSFKIEGRMKTPYYVGTVTNAYRRAIDGGADTEELKGELDCVSHRPYSSGFYFGREKDGHYNDGAYHTECSFAAKVLDSRGDEMTVEQRNAFSVGDELEVVSPCLLGAKLTVEKIISAEGEPKKTASLVQEHVRINGLSGVRPGDLLRMRVKNDG